MDWLDRFGDYVGVQSPLIGFIGILFIFIIGISLYYLTGDNNPYSRQRKAILSKNKNKPIPIKGIIEADYKIIEVSREPLEKEKEAD